ncbi:leucine-rich repeat receptor-like protein kinase PXC2 [Impatiens glandulifera]|uniref:leucine-rich repeat receptor-like protein kinase PXC2 n=1 Tax=Impatiens glandulifera TaxID=253017 RepID=UPI001FB16BBD|nr:leucine-rich repeat receptor-like protein kinase PXC2 [Impatiens glandulifera]
MLLNIFTYIFLFSSTFFFSYLIASTDPPFNDDVLGLIAFKAGLIDPESKLSSWNEDDDDPFNWVGVKCDPDTRRVTELNLDGFTLSGHIGRSLLRVQFLQVLSLSGNNFNGTINPILSQFENLLVLDLSHNSLSGSIPDELFRQCRSLKTVSLGGNNLTGPIPDSLNMCLTLEQIDFSSNQLSGSLESGIWSISKLQSLDLSNNFFVGEIPVGIGSLNALKAVNLSMNNLNGELPADIGDCLSLKSIDYSWNFLSGDIPDSIKKLGFCQVLCLSGNSFTGEVPEWIGEMTSLEILDLSANNLTGRIPSSIGELRFLKEVNLSMNMLSGGLPESIRSCNNLLLLDVGQNLLTGNFPPWIFGSSLQTVSLSGNKLSGEINFPSSLSSPDLQMLDVSSNSLSGEVSYGVGRFSNLKFLNLSGNYFVGSIPSSIGELNFTEVIDFSSNELHGSIPSEIGSAYSLQKLNLGKNFLSGDIPIQIGNCFRLIALILSENNLTGSIPLEITNLTELELVDLSFNELSGSLPKELTNLSHLLQFNISHNRFQGELPVGGFFNTIPLSSVSNNPSMCGSILNNSCPAVHPKPLVLNPNSSSGPNSGPLSSNFSRRKIGLSISAFIAIAAAIFIIMGVVIITVLNIHARSSIARAAAAAFKAPPSSNEDDCSRSPGNDSSCGKLVMFSGEAGFDSGAQSLLNKDSELGRGGFGSVYKTVLNDGRSVAIKKLNISSLIKSQEEFEREIKILSEVRHKNLVAVEGYYWTPSLQLVMNEYVSNGTLYKHLHECGNEEEGLNWRQRLKAILGIAKGLCFLHEQNLIHYNIKSTNVLIDETGEAKVGDYGLARLLPMLDRYILSCKIQSALGYMAPEFACRTVKITEKCDVYGFGILVLEVVTGKRPVEYMEDDVVVLCDLVRGAVEEGRAEDCVDSKMKGGFQAEEVIPVIKLGLICASQVPSNRPDMEEVVKILELIC